MGHMVSEFPLCWIWFIANLAVDPPVNKFDFSQIVFVSGFLHNGGILNFGGIPIALRATTFQLLQFCVSIGYYFFPLLPSCRTSGAKDLTTTERFIRLIAVRGRVQLSCRASRKRQHKCGNNHVAHNEVTSCSDGSV
jgi:hypothetical protein